MNFWGALGIEPTTDKMAIRHAYAEKTRTFHPEEDPEGFDRLHTAFNAAMQYARRNAGTATVMETQKEPLRENAAQQAENDFCCLDAQSGENTQRTHTRRGAKERYERGKASRESRRKTEARVLEEYLAQAQRQPQRQIELGQGSQEEGQQFDFDGVAQEEFSQPVQQSAEPRAPRQTNNRLTHEEIAWINTPGLQEAEKIAPEKKPSGAAASKAQGKTNQKSGLVKKSNRQELLPPWAMRLLPLAVMLFGRYILAVLLAVFVSWYDMHTVDFKRVRKQLRFRIKALWCAGIVVIPVAALWVIAIVGGIRGGADNLDVMVAATLLSVLIAPAGLIGIYTSKKVKPKKRTTKTRK